MPQTKPAAVSPGAVPLDSAVSVRNVSKNYGPVEALKNLSLEFPRGELTSLLGPSGFREKDVENIRRDPEYLDIVDQIWSSLRTYAE